MCGRVATGAARRCESARFGFWRTDLSLAFTVSSPIFSHFSSLLKSGCTGARGNLDALISRLQAKDTAKALREATFWTAKETLILEEKNFGKDPEGERESWNKRDFQRGEQREDQGGHCRSLREKQNNKADSDFSLQAHSVCSGF